MEKILAAIIPDNYLNFIGSLSLFIAIFCLLISFNEKQRSHATKLFAIIIVTSLSLFSAHWTTYFAAIFIVATAVTELEFLQNLAAIIRKDKNYFDFKKESLTKAENIRRKVEDTVEEELVSTSEEDDDKSKNTKIDLSTLKDASRTEITRLAFDIEDHALDLLAKTYGPIERGQRLRKNGITAEYDGIIFNKINKNKVFEVKWTRSPKHTLAYIMNSINKAKSILELHKGITGTEPELHLVVVTNTETSITPDRVNRLTERAKSENISIVFLSLSAIGIEVTNNTD